MKAEVACCPGLGTMAHVRGCVNHPEWPRERGNSVSVPLLGGLSGDAKQVSDLSPRVSEHPHLIDGAGDVGVDVVASGNEGLKADGAAVVGHASRLVDTACKCQDGLTIPPTTTVTVVIPKRLWLTSNRHAINRGHRAAIVRELHDEMFKAAYRANLPKLGAGPVEAHWTVHYPKGVSWLHGDASNSQPTTKCLLDALVPRWLDGDGPLIVTAETFTRGPNLDRASDHEITLTLTEAAA